jgi:hypothetical protein
MIWGQNIKDFKTTRKLGRQRPPIVEVISFNPELAPGQQTMVARYPPLYTKPKGGKGKGGVKPAGHIGHKGQWKADHVETFNIGAVRDQGQLEQIARGLWHDIARQEMGVRIETDDMASWFDPRLPIDPNEEPDLIRLRPGIPVQVLMAVQNNDPAKGPIILTPLSHVFELRQGQLEKWVREQAGRFQLGDQATSQMWQRFARAYQTAKFTDTFYCRAIHIRVHWQEGWSAEMELVNFLESRWSAKYLGEEAQAIDEARRIPAQRTAPPTMDEQVGNLLALDHGWL